MGFLRFANIRFTVALATLLAACGSERRAPAAPTIVLRDDSQHEVRLAAPARRIVSLIPSSTETVMALGARDRLVGRTRYDRDTSIATLPSVGGGLDPSIEAIVALKPDLVITWSSDKRGDLRERLAATGIPTLALALQDTTDAYRALTLLGRALGLEERATHVTDSVRAELADVAASVRGQKRPRVFYVVFNNPPMTTGPNTFIAQLVDIAGAENVFADSPTNWPTVAMEEVVRRAPEIVVLPTGEMRDATLERLRSSPGWRSLPAVRDGKIAYIDADLANRPGPSMGRAARTLRDALREAMTPRK